MDDKLDKNSKIKLPFEKERFDLGVWVYNHQLGLSITLGIYLIMIVALLFGYITLKSSKKDDYLTIDMQTLAQLQEQRDRLQEAIENIQQESAEIEDVSNRVSNENAASDISREISFDMQDILDEAAEVQRRADANRQSYENSMAELADLQRQLDEQSQLTDTTSHVRQDEKVAGNVTVSYSLINPIRNATKLTVPAYLCEGGGMVEVQITVERSGLVSNAKITKSAADECIEQSALLAAYSTEFNISSVAPARHIGKITYIFIAQ